MLSPPPSNPLILVTNDSDPESPGPPQRVTRSKVKEGRLYPLREMLVPGVGAQGEPGAGYVAVPLNTGDVRDF